jgi:nicotinic acid mononucleotide adenylyltransferase
MIEFNKLYLGRRIVRADYNYAILSTAANPLHRGHIEIVNTAAKTLGYTPVIELSANNADKGRLSDSEIEQRVQPMINAGYHYIVSDIQSYIGKRDEYQETFYNATYRFVIGSDTFERILNPEQFIFSDYEELNNKLSYSLNGKFIIFNRPDNKTVLDVWNIFSNHLKEPKRYDEMFTSSVKSEDFYNKNIVLESTVNISSTQIRNQNAKDN